MIVRVQLSSGNSAPNSGNNHHLTIPIEGGMHIYIYTGLFKMIVEVQLSSGNFAPNSETTTI